MELIDRTCVDCRKQSPETQTQYTLISKHGWRVTRATTLEGHVALEWRCPPCWASFKARRPRVSSLPPPATGTSVPPVALPKSMPAPAQSDAKQDQAADHAGRLFDRAVEALGSKPPRGR